MVTTYDIIDWERQADGRMVFNGTPSANFGRLIGTPNPGKPWVRGQARPVQYLDTAVLNGGTATIESLSDGRRAVVEDFVLTVDDDGSAPRGAGGAGAAL